jgi:uncharacterized membrane protein
VAWLAPCSTDKKKDNSGVAIATALMPPCRSYGLAIEYVIIFLALFICIL